MPDLVTMIGNLSKSMDAVQSLIAGGGYLLGIALVVSGLIKFTKISVRSREGMSIPFAYILGGSALIFLPTSIDALSNTLFGITSALEYTSYNPYNIYESMMVLIKTAGLLWFVRGSVLLVNAAKPGEQHGPKGFAFVLAGICALNIEYTIGWVDWLLAYLMSLFKGPV